MTAIATLRSGRKTFKVGSPLDQWAVRELARKPDPAIETAAAATNEVVSLADSTQTSGGMVLNFSIRQSDGRFESFTTGAIDFEETAAAIETIIDTAATTASITGWTNGDISVSGTAIDVGPIVFTYDGDAVSARNNVLITLTDTDGAGGAWGAISLTTNGQTSRPALSILLAYGVITGSIPVQEADAASRTAFTKGTDTVNRIPAVLVKSLMREAAAEDASNSTYFSLEASLMRQDKAPLVEPRTTNDGLIHNV
jgi:hypothetical protein